MGARIVYATGCWDLLHVGHLFFLERAAALGDALVIGVNTDEFIRSYKPGPVIPFEQRCEMVSHLPLVEALEPHSTFDDVGWIDRYRATIRAVGPEFGVYEGQKRCLDEMERRGVQVVEIPWGPDVSTQKIKEGCCEEMVTFGCPLATGRLQVRKTAHVRHHSSRRG